MAAQVYAAPVVTGKDAEQWVMDTWYVADATRRSAEDMLFNADDGTFIVRPSSKAGCLALSFSMADEGVGHSLLQRSADGGWQVDEMKNGEKVTTGPYTSLVELIANLDFLILPRSVRAVIAEPHGYEVDTNRAGGDAANAERLMSRADGAVRSVVAAAKQLDDDVFRFFALVRHHVDAHFPGEYAKAAAGFLFLRFLCPAVSSPTYFGLTGAQPPRDAQRALVLVAKLLQNLANDVQFGGKEAYLVPCNAFIERRRADARQFFDVLAAKGDRLAHELPAAPPEFRAADKLRYLEVLVRHVTDHYALVDKEVNTHAERYDVNVVGRLLQLRDLCSGVDDGGDGGDGGSGGGQSTAASARF